MLRKPLDKSLTLEIEAVARYAYGQYDDGSIALWALGKAGWFELEPSRKYRPIFDGMIEAVVLLYYIADYYKRKLARRSPHAEKIDDFFAKVISVDSHVKSLLPDAQVVSSGVVLIY